MNLLKRLFNSTPASQDQNSSNVVVDDFGPAINFGSGANESGVSVTEESSLAVSTVWRAVNCIVNSINGLPLHLQERESGKRLYDNSLYYLLHDEPNQYMSALSFRTSLMSQALLWGNSYAYVSRDELGRPVAIYPLTSKTTVPFRVDGEMFYRTTIGKKSFDLPAADVIHIMALTLDGIHGLSPIEYQRQTVGITAALDRFAAKYFGKGANIGGILSYPKMDEDARKAFIGAIQAGYSSINNAFKILPLQDTYKFTPTGVNPRDSQAIESRVHQIREVARIFGVPPHKLMDLERATFSNIEHQSIEFMQECIGPWVCKLESEFNRKLLLQTEKPILEIKFNLDAMLRSDTKTRYEAYNLGLQAGFLKVNEVRATEGLAPVEGGDTLRVPLNMAPAAQQTLPAPADPSIK